MNELVKEVSDIVNNLLSTEPKDNIQIQYDSNLEEYGFSSLEFIQLIIILEEKYAIEIADEMLLIDEMNTINKIVSVIENTQDLGTYNDRHKNSGE